MKTKTTVLDHGFVRLVSCMQPVPESIATHDAVAHTTNGYLKADHGDWSGDLEVIRNARVSYDADWRVGEDEKDAKLIAYLMKNRHTSPFEAMVFTFEVMAPIMVFRQWQRHRMWSYNELSARYAPLPEIFYVPEVGQFGAQSASNKQMRSEAEMTDETKIREERWQYEQRQHMKAGFDLYRKHMEEGMPRELARDSLPFSTYSRMFGTVDLHNLFHFIGLRSHSHAQHEIRVYSDAMLDLVEQICPHSVAAFRKFRLEQAPLAVATVPAPSSALVVPEPTVAGGVVGIMGKPNFHGDLGFLNKK